MPRHRSARRPRPAPLAPLSPDARRLAAAVRDALAGVDPASVATALAALTRNPTGHALDATCSTLATALLTGAGQEIGR